MESSKHCTIRMWHEASVRRARASRPCSTTTPVPIRLTTDGPFKARQLGYRLRVLRLADACSSRSTPCPEDQGQKGGRACSAQVCELE